MNIIKVSNMKAAKSYTDSDRTHKAIEYLLQAHVISVVDEARKYCYKTFDGIIGVVDRNFIQDRVLSNLY